MALRECNTDSPIFFPVRPIAKLFCEVWRLLPYSRYTSIVLFAICCILLFISYVLTRHVAEYAQELVLGTIEDRLKRKVAITLGGWAIQLFVSNSVFFLFRGVLAALVYVIYQLGRDAVFALILLFLTAAVGTCAFEYYTDSSALNQFFNLHRVELILAFFLWTLSIWYWRRYLFRNRNNYSIFDHDVGAALVRLKR